MYPKLILAIAGTVMAIGVARAAVIHKWVPIPVAWNGPARVIPTRVLQDPDAKKKGLVPLNFAWGEYMPSGNPPLPVCKPQWCDTEHTMFGCCNAP